MGILSRFSEIMKANVNALLDKCEDPEKMIDQTLRSLKEDLAKVKKETAGVMADSKAAKRRLDECKDNVQKYTNAAKNALVSGNEEDARVLLERKQQYETQLASLAATYRVASENAEKMSMMYQKLVKDINEMELKRDSIKAKFATAKAREHINEVTSGIGKGLSVADFNKYEEKADKMLDAAEASAELSEQINATSNLADKYTNKNKIGVDAELEAMKAELGLK